MNRAGPVNEEIAIIPRPTGRPSIYFRWLHLLFVHWPVPVEMLRPLVPAGLEVDTFDGVAWVGLVPFTMRGVRHALMPPIPTMHHFHECNVRTYVSLNGDRGVWFFSLDAASRIAVHGARLLWNLNYVHSRMSLDHDGDTIRYAVQRRGDPQVTLRCTWRAGAARKPSRPGELAHFLTERYMLFTADRRGRIHRSRIWHVPWPLRDAKLLELDDGLVSSSGIDVAGSAPHPLLLHADSIDVAAWGLERERMAAGDGGRRP